MVGLFNGVLDSAVKKEASIDLKLKNNTETLIHDIKLLIFDYIDNYENEL